MADPSNDVAVKLAIALLKQYGFDQGELTADQLLDHWLRSYPARWIRMALIQALYQGRYKAVSVEQILRLWLRRGQPTYHFNHEFERLVCNDLPRVLAQSGRAQRIETDRVQKPTNAQSAFPEKVQRTSQAETSNRQAVTPAARGTSEGSPSQLSANDLRPQSVSAKELPTESSSPKSKPRTKRNNAKAACQGESVSQSPTQPTYTPQRSAFGLDAPLPAEPPGSLVDNPDSGYGFQVEHPPIHQFQPYSQDSNFSDKLLAIAKVWKQTPETEKVLPPLPDS